MRDWHQLPQLPLSLFFGKRVIESSYLFMIYFMLPLQSI